MKQYIALFLVLIFTSSLLAQDSIKTFNENEISKEKFNYKKLILPASLIAVGGILKIPSIQTEIQKSARNTFGENFHTEADNYLQFLPVVQMLGGNLLGFKSKHGYKQIITNTIISNFMVAGISYISKTVAHDLRPDGSANNSFPSGHTATAFNNATLLFLEYKDSNIWYASSGYLFAATTGVLRMANNRHWSGDVVAGAGIGIVIGTVVNYWNPFNFDKKNKQIGLISYPIINDKSYGVGMIYQIK
jgi:membrane-associated phospholipid phosphatase